MLPIVPDAPWWANLALLLVAILAAATASVWGAHLASRKRLDAIAQDAKATRDSVVNDHATDMRSDLDALMRAMESNARRLEGLGQHLADVDGSVRALGHSLDRRTDIQERALAEAVRDGEAQLEQAIAERGRELAAIRREIDAALEGCPRKPRR